MSRVKSGKLITFRLVHGCFIRLLLIFCPNLFVHFRPVSCSIAKSTWKPNTEALVYALPLLHTRCLGIQLILTETPLKSFFWSLRLPFLHLKFTLLYLFLAHTILKQMSNVNPQYIQCIMLYKACQNSSLILEQLISSWHIRSIFVIPLSIIVFDSWSSRAHGVAGTNGIHV